jgi:hypothetical protein
MSPSAGAAPVRRPRHAAGRAVPHETARPAVRAQPRAHLRVAPDVSRAQRRARVVVWGVTLVSVALVFLLVAFHVVAVQHAFELDRLAEERTDQERRYERLREQVATMSAPDAIVAAATKLGMVPADHVEAIQAPPAAPRGVKQDPTADTLGRSWDEAKRHLGADP